ncbi:MAG: tRNA uridine-5-carboxymethylaminomethyl(34) synthesis GTPase MnmE [Pseudomonadota bacterium]
MVDRGEDTICALASGAGQAGVAVIRVSGRHVPDICARMLGRLPKPRFAGLVSVRASDGTLIDSALAIRFEDGASFTGEPVLELHTHGSQAVINRVLSVLTDMDGVRPAEPGEFTRRAFENGKMNLTEVEGLADLIEAETESQRQLALDVMTGGLSDRLGQIRDNFLRAAALIEATIDFADEEVPVDVMPEVSGCLGIAETLLKEELDGFEAARIRREGFTVALVGPPNAGKSSLLNRLAGWDAAIVSDIAGTTRDVVEVVLRLKGLPVRVLDTAGLRETDDPVEKEGVRRTRQRAEAANLRVFLSEDGVADPATHQAGDIVLKSKIDVSGGDGISAKTGQGVKELVAAVEQAAIAASAGSGLTSHVRQKAALENAQESLQAAQNALDMDAPPEVVVFELTAAMRAVDGVLGRIDVEDVLGEIFSSFCIGK